MDVPGVMMTVDGEPPKPTTLSGGRSFVTPGFFDAAGHSDAWPGRDFTERDRESASSVVIINASMARFYFGSEAAAIGRMVQFPRTDEAAASDRRRDQRLRAHHAAASARLVQQLLSVPASGSDQSRVAIAAARDADRDSGAGDAAGDRRRRPRARFARSIRCCRSSASTPPSSSSTMCWRRIAWWRRCRPRSARRRCSSRRQACSGCCRTGWRAAPMRSACGWHSARRARGVRMVLAESGRLVAAGLVVGVIAALMLARLVSSRLYRRQRHRSMDDRRRDHVADRGRLPGRAHSGAESRGG